MRSTKHHFGGFSLVETVVALGLFAFCILPIIGLMPVGMGAARSVAQEAQAANLAEAFFGAWQVRPQGATEFPIPGMFTNPAVPLTAQAKTVYFAGDGAQLSGNQGASMQLDYKITTADNAATITLDFIWPANASGSSTNAASQRRSFSRTIPL